ncbi:MAG: carboxypeptidase-like regulatory domain-containing protein [Pseudomonadota bacterium]|nr:carboxypeptidase-like regulatory domain-containing protein [Pseudomonadota bacterium]
MPFLRSLPLLSLLLLAATGCAGPTDGTDTGACSSGSYWTGGDEESPLMNPGQSCIACHDRGEGPTFTVAGTVMGDYGDVDDCDGVEGVTVRLTDADGAVHEATSNAAGNFYLNDAIAMPYTVELESDAGVSTMSTAPTTGDCASCHTADGAEGAPGRVVAPF